MVRLNARLLPLIGWLTAGAAPFAAGSARAAEAGALEAAPIGFTSDAALKEALRDAVLARPELRQARALIEAERERAPQARTLPDPSIALGIQNDGFRAIQIGKMETSWVSIGAAQSFPWFGKRELRAGVAESQARRAEADLARAALTVQAEVERAYLDLLEIRDEQELLGRMEALWSQSESMARSRYQSGDGVQSDLLRAQLARNRLRQRRLTLQANENRRLLVMNRLRGKPAGEPFVSARHLRDFADPVLPELSAAIAAARERSPELHATASQQEQAERQIALVRRDAYPDLVVNAAVMPRGGQFETMWQAGISVSVPVWSASKRTHAVAESRARAAAAGASADAIGHLLEQRIRERHALLQALVETNRIYRSGLLVQSEATVASTLAQYRVGKVPMASVLEAMAGYVTDMSGFLQSIGQAQRLEIAERELSLAELGGGGGGGGGPAGGGSMSSGGTGGGALSPQASGGGDGAGPSSAGTSSAMSNM